ncbi:hypothetical protein K402DRAFT_459245 [Aulographum hederae CBS 113979]|uniref:Uncharacterized protein n=1 Tax=Aulographum hederae CBS 113979 TaxID=1176131 RepID=A0A6G1HFP3_9PEZI|nr:hypothetical protein K402DRAFT_459245 [Aulographum hederae CBS 113979]
MHFSLICISLYTIGVAVATPGHVRQPLTSKSKLVARQSMPAINLPTMEAFDTKEVEPKADSSAIRKIMRWGPLRVNAKNGTHTGKLDPTSDAFSAVLDGMCTDCMYITGSTYLTYANGSRASIATGIYNHHVFVGDIGKKQSPIYSCSTGANTTTPNPETTEAPAEGGHADMEGMSAEGEAGHSHGDRVRRDGTSGLAVQLLGSGDDGAPMSYASSQPDVIKTGFYVGKEEKVMHSSEYVNYKDYPQDIYMTIDYEYIPGKPEGYSDALHSSFTVTGCGGAGYEPAKNKASSILSPPLYITAAGTFLNAQAHLHDGGINVRIFLNRALVCDSVAEYGSADAGEATEVGGEAWTTIKGYTGCSEAISMEVGDEVVVEASYDPTKHRLRPGAVDHSMMGEAMGMMGFVYAIKQ